MYRTKDQVAQEFIAEGRRRGIAPRGIVICIATGLVESNLTVYANAKVPGSLALPHDAVGSDGMSVGPLQQQVIMGNGWWWGPVDVCQDPTKSAGLFYDRLAKLPYQNTTDAAAGAIAQQIQKSAFPDRYAQRMSEAQGYYDRLSTPGGTVGVSGDPVWLEDVLRPALGDRLKTLPGWQTDGVGGTMGTIWGVIWHHTGNAAEKPESISVGRPDLSGPLAQIHIAPDGIVTIVAVGPCNHAGAGSWPGLPTDNANAYTIGIECAWPRDTSLTEATASREPWPDAQIISMRDVGAALTKHLGVPVSHNISHREWARFGPAGQRQFKWDPGNLDMDWFRGEIQKDIDGFEFPGEHPEVTPPAEPKPVVVGPADDQLTYRWNCLGGQTVVETLAELRDHITGSEDRGKTGVVTQ
ncbi:N-acetylmuramoyl-L-alanine amidase [Mycolicibacterium conceptionense]|uniref:N-acetylmuramoyl-L-alanine amidase n=1 Tax=Mycolicibacterium conceptionense TaxID=451644 RepID=UPI000B14A256|nr:N-acetylmuramoyl-L-alanine amidase [Mycolicibacterium conceptionense]